MRNGILAFWNASANTSAKDKASNGSFDQANLANWYPDAVAQIYPIIFGVVTTTEPKAINAYSSLNAAFPNWDKFQFNDSPLGDWAIVGYAAALMRDAGRANQYRMSVESRFVNVSSPFSYPWYDAEDGWFMRMLAVELKTAMNL